VAHLRRELAERRFLQLGKHEVVPRRGRQDALRQVFEPWPRQRAARVPQVAGLQRLLARAEQVAGRRDGPRAQPKLFRHVVERPVQGRGGVAEGRAPQLLLLEWTWLVGVESHERPVQADRLARRDEDHAGQPFQEVGRGRRQFGAGACTRSAPGSSRDSRSHSTAN
jgi:hypothetical protein